MTSYPDFMKSTRYGYPDGLKGINCRHDFYPFFPAWQTPVYSAEELKVQAERDAKTILYSWKDTRGVAHEREFTRREALDRQRDMERQMRRTRALAVGYKSGGNLDEYKAAKARYTAQRAEYARFSEAMDIKPDWNRINVDGLDRI